MNSRTEDYHLNTKLTLWEFPQFSFSLPALLLSLIWQEDLPIECHLTFQVNPELYQHIETDSLFNLKPEIRTSLPTNEFLSEPDITLKASLKPELLPLLAKHTDTIDQLATYLLDLNQSNPDSSLFSTESWLVLSAKQQQPSGEVSYRTLWSYINPTALTQSTDNSDDISKGLINFFKDWAEINLTTTTQIAANQALEGITSFLEQFAEFDLDKLLDQIPERFLDTTDEDTNLLKTIIHFFTIDDWTFTKLQGQPVLQVACQGKNGQWFCYAHAKEHQQQFIFYSICPITAPEDKRQTTAEFLTRANYGMAIGNFELDLDDGEIRYKTSIDVEGSTLEPALINQLVYANVVTMDQYLPGILAVLEQGMDPKAAIDLVES